MRIRGAVATVILVSCALLSACGAAPGSAVPQDWTSSVVFSGLRSIPANSDSKFEIGLVSASRLNALNSSDENPKPTTAPASGLRPPSEYAWTNYSIAGSVCSLLESQYGASTVLRTGPPGDMLSVYNGSPDTGQTIGVCQGTIDTTGLKGTPKTLGGVSGTDVNGIWIGRGHLEGLTYQFGSKVPDALTSALIAGSSGSGTLADDPDVLAVLDANPQAAAIEMGRVFVGIGSFRSKAAMGDLLEAAESAQGKKLPQPTFGGYGWTSTAGLTGTGAFVTRYASAADATTAAALLSGLWPKATDTPFAKATTEATAETVVTRLPNIKVTDFNLRTLRIADYPGFGSKRTG